MLAAVCVVALVVMVPAAIALQPPREQVGAVLVGVGLLFWLKRLDGWRRLYALSLALLIAGSSSFEAVVSAAFYPRYAALALLVAWTWRAHRADAAPLAQCPPPARGVVWGLYILTVLAAASTAWSYDPTVTIQQAVALGLLSTLVHGLVTRRWVVRERIGGDLRVAYLVLVGAASASIAAQLAGVPEASAFLNERLQGVFSNPNVLGMAVVLAVPLGWGAYLETRRVGYLLGLVPVIYALLLCGSRTAQLAAAAAALWLLLRAAWQPKHTVPALLGAAIVAVLGVIFSGALTRFAAVDLSRFNSVEGGGVLNSRTLAWQAALNLWERKPWLGWGYQAGESLFTDQIGVVGFSFARASVHNSYLQLLLELGVAGAVVLAFLLLMILMGIFRSPLVGANVGAVGVLVAGLVVHMTESAIFGTGQIYPFVYWLAAAAVLLHYPSRPKASRPQKQSAAVTAAERALSRR